MAKRKTGTFERRTVGDEEVGAFVPAPLPPAAPPLVVQGKLLELARRAEDALVRLELAGEMLPSMEWLLYAFVRKEAVLSSQIEGTQATLVDLLEFEAAHDGVLDPDVEEVCNYLEALSYARGQLADPDGLPLSMRLLHEAHARLMRGVRGADKQPGEIRRSQNWIGGTRPGNAAFVPPPPHAVPEALASLERYIYADDSLPLIVRTALIHVQLETIHPYLDGNGRIGRLLVTLLLEHWKLLTKPLLYLSLHLKRHRDEYYRRLDAVRRDGDWEGWLDFFLGGVATIADEAVTSARELFALVTADRTRLLEHARTSVAAVRLFELMPRNPIVSVASVVNRLAVSKPTAARALDALVTAGVLVETSGKKRDRAWAYQRYLDQLRLGTEIERPRRR